MLLLLCTVSNRTHRRVDWLFSKGSNKTSCSLSALRRCDCTDCTAYPTLQDSSWNHLPINLPDKPCSRIKNALCCSAADTNVCAEIFVFIKPVHDTSISDHCAFVFVFLLHSAFLLMEYFGSGIPWELHVIDMNECPLCQLKEQSSAKRK